MAASPNPGDWTRGCHDGTARETERVRYREVGHTGPRRRPPRGVVVELCLTVRRRAAISYSLTGLGDEEEYTICHYATLTIKGRTTPGQ
jgi:hypothetical protein